MAPSIGTIVGYVDRYGVDDPQTGMVRPAIITAIHTDNTVDLVVFNHHGAQNAYHVPYDVQHQPKTWHALTPSEPQPS